MEPDPKSRHYVMMKVLLKRSFDAEMKLFMANPQVRNDLTQCPTLYRVYRRVLSSPLFLEEELGLVEQFVEGLPKLQLLIRAATERDIAREVVVSFTLEFFLWCY
jgi:hypothetical protein